MPAMATMMAVKPCPPAVLVEIVWSLPATIRNPARPQMAPEISMVRTRTQRTLMPA